MIKFLMYLFETGLCLTILFLVYLFFFRKETYFQFNRFYLVSIIFFSLVIPLLHLNFHVKNTQRYAYSFKGIGKFRSYYEQLIAMTDPDYLGNETNTNIIFEGSYAGYNSGIQHNVKKTFNLKDNDKQVKEASTKKRRISISIIFLIVYLTGVVIFLSRMVYLGAWLKKIMGSSSIENKSGFKLVKLTKNLPPFSFLSYIFINENILHNEKFEQVVAHELTHIKQKHSFDLLFAHALSIFQWFNPFIWYLQKTIKTNHEYIADREVVRRGVDLLNYQELLLNQFLAIRSVELVNNFNLISIKKRIAMMNKIKSGFLARFKILMVIPAAIFTFFLFANLTLNGTGNVLKNFNFLESYNNMKKVKGLWKNVSKDSYGKMVLLENMKFSILEEDNSIKEYPMDISENQLVLSSPENEKTILKYELSDNTLKIWWSDTDFSLFTKSDYLNTLDDYLSQYNVSINLPVIKNYRLLTRTDLCIDILMTGDKIFVNKIQTNYKDLKNAILREKSKINQLNANLISIRLYADKDLSMKYIHKLNQALRELNLLKIVHMGKITEHDVSMLQRNYASMPKMLPPLSAKELELSDLKNESITFFEMDIRIKGITPDLLRPEFEKMLSQSEKYVSVLYYNEKTTLENYLGYHDMARSVVYWFRNEYAMNRYNLNYVDLSPVQQKEIRKVYPLIISEKFFKTE